jgi:hypothetical protein
MLDDPYRDADLVELYDPDNPGGEDHAYYRALADAIDAALYRVSHRSAGAAGRGRRAR